MICYEYVELAEFQHNSHFVLAKVTRELLCPQANFGLGTFCLYRKNINRRIYFYKQVVPSVFNQITMSGGTADCMEASGNSQAIMSGGTVVGSLFVRDSSQLTMSGGTVGYLFSDGGQTTMSGGRLSETLGIRLDTGAELIIEGSNFAIDGTLFGFGEITSILGGGYTLEPYRRITGTLSNGDVLNTQFQIGRNASITLVPEPCTLLLLGLGAVMLRRKF